MAWNISLVEQRNTLALHLMQQSCELSYWSYLLNMYWMESGCNYLTCNFALDFTVGLCHNWGNDLKWSSHCGIFILVGLSHTKKTGSSAIPSI